MVNLRGTFLVMVFLLMSVFSFSQELPVILKKHFEAHGQELWDQVGTVVVDGQWVTKEFDKYPMRLTFKSPNKIRIEGTWQGKRYAEVTNGRVAWTVAPWTGTSKPQLMTPLEHLTIENVFHLGSSLREYEHKLNLEGLQLFEGEILIKLVYEDDYTSRTYYLGREDYVLYWEVIKSKVGNKLEVTKQYEKYHDYHGLLTPTALRVSTSKGERELVFDDVALGVGASNKIFEMPKSQ
ncbi:MAG: hypothetical protein JXR03_14760 [Cyclobacteriaceae bacterium]